jgi:hypothetical protein
MVLFHLGVPRLDRHTCAAEHEIWGWAWADGGIRHVHVRSGDAAVWRTAEVEPPRQREWQIRKG